MYWTFSDAQLSCTLATEEIVFLLIRYYIKTPGGGSRKEKGKGENIRKTHHWLLLFDLFDLLDKKIRTVSFVFGFCWVTHMRAWIPSSDAKSPAGREGCFAPNRQRQGKPCDSLVLAYWCLVLGWRTDKPKVKHLRTGQLTFWSASWQRVGQGKGPHHE